MTDKKIFRFHKIIMLKKVVAILIFFLLIFKRDFKDILTGKEELSSLFENIGYVGITIIFFAILGLVRGFLIYKNSYLEVTENSVIFIKQGFFSTKHKESKLSRISNVSIQKNLFDKIFGVSTLKLDIDSAETADEDDYSILLKDRDAELLRNFITLHDENLKKYGETSLNLDCFEENETFVEDLESKFTQVYTYSFVDYVKQIVLSSSLSIVYIIFFIFLQFKSASSTVFKTGTILVMLSAFYDIFRKVSKYHDFTVKANGEKLSWQYGLFNKRTFDVDKTNIKSVQIKQSFLARIFRQYSVSVTVVGVGSSDEEMTTIILYSSKDKVCEMLKELLGEDLISGFEKEHIIVAFVKSVIWTLVLSLLLMFEVVRNNWYYLTLFNLLVVIIIFSKTYGTGYLVKNGKIYVLSSLFGATIKQLDINKVEFVTTHDNFIYRKFGLMSMNFTYKGTAGADEIKTGYVRSVRECSLI